MKQSVSKELKRFQCGKYLVAFVLKQIYMIGKLKQNLRILSQSSGVVETKTCQKVILQQQNCQKGRGYT